MPNRPYVNTNPNDVTEYIVIVDGAGQAVNGDGGLIESVCARRFKMKFFCFCDQYGNEYNAFVTSITPGDGLDSVVLPDGSTQVSLKPAQLAELGGLFAKTPIEGQYVVGLDESGNLIFESIGDIDLPGGSTGTGPIVLQNAPTINNPVIQVPGVYGGQWTGGVLNSMTSHNEIADSGSYTNSSMKGTKADGLTLTAPPGVTVVDGVTQHPGGGIDFWTASGIDFSSDSNHLLRSALIDSWGLPKVSASATVPTLLTRRTDLTTGLGGPAGELDMIISGVSQLKADATGLRDKGGNYIVPYTGMRNRIINGDMRIDQRHAGATVNTSAYTVDRWNYVCTVPGTLAVGRVNGINATAHGITQALLATVAVTHALVATDYFVIVQTIEGFNVSDLLWGTAAAKPITVSFWAFSTGPTGQFGGVVRNGGITRSYPFLFNIPTANVWTYCTVTIPGDVTGAWPVDNSAALSLVLSYGTGATYSGTPGVWSGSNYLSATGAVSIVNSATQGLYLTGVQLESGSAATPFERRPYGVELQLCQRYYCKTYDASTAPGTATGNGMIECGPTQAGSANAFNYRFPNRMRIPPNSATFSSIGTVGNWTWWGGGDLGATLVNIGEAGGTITFPGTGVPITANGIVYGHVVCDAEI